MKSKENSTPSQHPREAFVEWYHATKLGQLVQKAETAYLLSVLQLTYNHQILQVGSLCTEYQYIQEEFRRNLILITPPNSTPTNHPARTWARTEELPIANDSIDTLILPHVLEFEPRPPDILAEAERILKPGGHLHILALNPWSLDRIFKRLPACQSNRSRLIGYPRILHWLSLLKFDAEFRVGLGRNLIPGFVARDNVLRRAVGQLACAYAIHAIKRAYTLIPVKPWWTSAPPLSTERILETPLLQKNQ